MIATLVRRFAPVAFACVAVQNAAAQGVDARIGRLFAEQDWTIYRLTFDRPLVEVVGLELGGLFADRAEQGGNLVGGTAEFSIFRRPTRGPYLIGGVGAGVGTGGARSWVSWSAGVGYQVFRAAPVSITGEARWRDLSRGRDGMEISLGLGIRFGGSRSRPEPEPATEQVGVAAPITPAANPVGTPALSAPSPVAPSATPAKTAPASLAEAVVATASEAMGKKYQFGGRGEGDDGFDCSGLIQYAYETHGIPLPRRSVDQAKEGRAVAKKLDELRTGDILTFSNKKKRITHVGLYVGNGRFIHSASKGVQESVLSADDPYGRWWYQRWVGVRRVVDEDAKVD